MTDATLIVRDAYAAWKVGNLEDTLPMLADDMVFALHIPPEVMPGGGEIVGKPAVIAALQGLLDTYEFLVYEPLSIEADATHVTATVHYRYIHRGSGETLDNRMRHRWTFRGQQAVRLDEWHDLDEIKSFVARVAQRMQAQT